MKRVSLTESTHDTGLSTRMVLLFMAATAGILSITAINLFLDQDVLGGGPSKTLITSLAALVAIGLIAFCTFMVTISITRPMEAILEFTRSVSEGRFDRRLALAGSREAIAVADALNAMAETIQERVSVINSVAGVLASCDDTLENAFGKLLEYADQHQSEVARTAAMIESIRNSIRHAAEVVEGLALSTGKSVTAILEMTVGIENVTVSAERLEKSFYEVDSSVREMADAGKRIGSDIVNLLDSSFETTSAIARMDVTIRRVKKNALEASSISEGVKIDAATGKHAVEESMAGMRAIRDSSAITAEVIENLSLRASDIGTILSVIDDVAEQINLLALNATIIAVQAGEQGKGFAVVADEIRELAERTSSSTREIASVIRGVQDETRRAVNAIILAETSISEGEKLSQHSGTALEKIVNGVEQASIQVNEIARATVEQAHDSQSIREAMERMAELINHIVTSDGEQAKTCKQISAAIERIKDLAVHVSSSAREQGQTFGLISHAPNEISDMIELLRESGRSQLQGCAMLSRSLDDSRTASASGTRTARTMSETVINLTKQVNLLEKELSGFTV